MKIFKITFAFAVAALCLASCFPEPDVQGFIGDNICLQDADTIIVKPGKKSQTSVAWLDNSTRPCHFEIYQIRDDKGNVVEKFLQDFPQRIWNTPYDYLTDTTLVQVMEKVTEVPMKAIMINEVNGQLSFLESMSKLELNPGEVYHVDVKVSNTKGEKDLKDYAIIKIQQGGDDTADYELYYFRSSIVLSDTSTHYLYRDQITTNDPNYQERLDHIIADDQADQKPSLRVYKRSAEPELGIEFYFRLFDKNGKVIDPALIRPWSTNVGYTSFGVERVDDAELGLKVEFPIVPWPTPGPNSTYCYTGTETWYDFTTNLDWEGIKADAAAQKNNEATERFACPDEAWPEDDWARKESWTMRFITGLRIAATGTWCVDINMPYVAF